MLTCKLLHKLCLLNIFWRGLPLPLPPGLSLGYGRFVRTPPAYGPVITENWVWAYNWGSCIFITLRERSSIIHTWRFHGWTRRVRVRIRPYHSMQLLDSVRIRPCLWHVRVADRIKNGGPYRCLSLRRVFLASKTSLSIAHHLQATFINRSSTCQAYIETLDKQTD